MEGGIPGLLAAALHSASTRLTSTDRPSDKKGEPSRRSRSRCTPGTPGNRSTTATASQTDTTAETRQQHNQ
jgi:hypothetical protein